MTHSDAITPSGDKGQNRRARVVVLGEFSAGKSTLINLLTDGNNLRTQVTATQMPPVWMSYGSDEPYRVDLNGKEHPVDPNDPDSISVSETLYIRNQRKHGGKVSSLHGGMSQRPCARAVFWCSRGPTS